MFGIPFWIAGQRSCQFRVGQFLLPSPFHDNILFDQQMKKRVNHKLSVKQMIDIYGHDMLSAFMLFGYRPPQEHPSEFDR